MQAVQIRWVSDPTRIATGRVPRRLPAVKPTGADRFDRLRFGMDSLPLQVPTAVIEPNLAGFLGRLLESSPKGVDLNTFVNGLFSDGKTAPEAERIFETDLQIPPAGVLKVLDENPELGKSNAPPGQFDAKMNQLFQTAYGILQSGQEDMTAPPPILKLGHLLHTLIFYNKEGQVSDPLIDAIRKLSALRMKDGEPQPSVLDKFSRDLTYEARNGLLSPVIGREQEIWNVMTSLTKIQKRTPVLVGEPGVGKATILAGLAHKLATGDVPAGLLRSDGEGKLLKVLDLSALDALKPTEVKTVFKQILDEAIERDKEVILAMDEFHRVNPKDGSASFANMLKSPLARGTVSMVGITTPGGFKESIEPDGMLTRQVEVISVEEPNEEQTLDMLRGLVEHFEKKHGHVRISDRALETAVAKCSRFLSGENMPDVAVDVIDKATAMVKNQVGGQSYPRIFKKGEALLLGIRKKGLQRRMEELTRESKQLEDVLRPEVETLVDQVTEAGKRPIHRVVDTHVDAVKITDPENAELAKLLASEHKEAYGLVVKKARKLAMHQKMIEETQQALDKLAIRMSQLQDELAGQGTVEAVVQPEDVCQVIATRAGMPVSQVSVDEKESRREKLKLMGDKMRERIVGQGAAIDAIVSAVTKNEMGMNMGNRPIGSFMFMGPTGVGKTELAKVLAEYLFDDEKNMIQLDMSEYMEKHSVSRLIGSPPGYVGYEEGGQLTNAVRKRPYSVVLIDEVEKAHPDVLNLFLQILEDGRLTDGQGHSVNFGNTIMLFTSNVGSQQIMKELSNMGSDLDLESDAYMNQYQQMKETLDGELKWRFKPEFLNRFDDLVIFHPLFRQQIRDIVDIQLKQLNKQLAANPAKIQVSLDDSAKDYLTDRGTDPELGARPLRREMDKLKTALSFALLQGEIHPGEQVEVDAQRLQGWEKAAELRRRGSRRSGDARDKSGCA